MEQSEHLAALSGSALARGRRALWVVLGVVVAGLAVGAVLGWVPVESRAFSASIPFKLLCGTFSCTVEFPVYVSVGGPTSMRFTGSWSTSGQGRILFEACTGSAPTGGCGYSSIRGAVNGSFSVSRPFAHPGPFYIVVLGISNGTSTTNVTGTVYSTAI